MCRLPLFLALFGAVQPPPDEAFVPLPVTIEVGGVVCVVHEEEAADLRVDGRRPPPPEQFLVELSPQRRDLLIEDELSLQRKDPEKVSCESKNDAT